MPLRDNKYTLSPSVFQPASLLREARRQKHLATVDVPAFCILDPDGDIVRRLRQNRASESPRPVMSVVLEASLEVRRAIVYATLIIVLAVMPVFFITSVSGAFFRPLVTSYGLAVLASMAVALTLTPALALLLLGRAPLDEKPPPLVRVHWPLRPTAAAATHYSAVAAAIVRIIAESATASARHKAGGL